MRIVVTGALGHIGSKLVRELPNRFPDVEIWMLDNLSTQRYPSLFNLSDKGRYKVLEKDILTNDLEATFAGADVVVHLAAITNATTSFEKKEEINNVNCLGTKRVAQACVDVGASLVFPSTTSVYGTQMETIDESCASEDLNPQSPYAESKLITEDYLNTLSKTGLRHVTCRFGTIFGVSPGMRFHTVVNKFCWQAVTGKPLTVWRTALDQKRPYLDLSDAVAAIKFVISKDIFDGKLYNVLTVNASVRTVIDQIRSHIPNVAIEYVDNEVMNQLSYEVSNERFKAQGFEFQGSLKNGIADTISLLSGVSNTAYETSSI